MGQNSKPGVRFVPFPRPRPGSSPPPSCSGGMTIGVGERGGCPRSPEPPRPTKTLPSNLIAFMHFVVDELQQEPHDVSQDEGGDEVPVNHVPQTANAPAGGPGQGSAGAGRVVGRGEGQGAVRGGGDSPKDQEKQEGHHEGGHRNAVAQVVDDEGNVVVQVVLPLPDTQTDTQTDTQRAG